MTTADPRQGRAQLAAHVINEVARLREEREEAFRIVEVWRGRHDKDHADRDALRAVVLQIVNDCDPSGGDWRCAFCGAPSACFGGYAGCHDQLRFACDECCGHGNEDGWCMPVTALRAVLGDK